MITNFKVTTTVDITYSRTRSKQDDALDYKAFQNYLTIINTIGLRVNPIVETFPVEKEQSKKFKDKCWELDFQTDAEGALTLEMLENDFHLVPFISNLRESVEFKDCVFKTKGRNKNIVFEILDK